MAREARNAANEQFDRSPPAESAAPSPDPLAASASAVAPTVPAVPIGRWAALEVPAFRRYFFALVVSNVGSWMQIIAQGWLVLELTDSALYLGLVGLARAVPTIAFSLVGGVIADRYRARNILMLTQSVAMLGAIFMTALTWSGHVQVWQILTISFIVSTFFAVDNPTRQAMAPDLVGRERLASAVGLSSAAWNGAAIIGPSLAGVIIAATSITAAFALNSLTFLPVLVAVALLPNTAARLTGRASAISQIAEGLAYIRKDRSVWGLLLLIALPSLFARPYVQMMPVFARDVLELGSRGFGLLMGASGIGALAGSLVVTSLGAGRRGRTLLLITGALGITLSAFSASHWVLPSVVLVVGVGFASTLMMSLANAVLQGEVTPALRGRVMSVYALIAAGLMPLGSAIIGAIGDLIGVPLVVGIAGGLTTLTALWISRLAPEVRRLE